MTSPFLNSKYVPPPLEPANPLYCILAWSIYTKYVSGKLVQGGGGGAYFKILNGDQPISLIIEPKKIALVHVSMIRICNKVKTKASVLQQYLLCLVVYQKNCNQNNRKLCFSTLNISGLRKCKYGSRYKNQSYLCMLTFVNSEGNSIQMIYLYIQSKR